jgi:hypothetical protein
VHSGDAELGQRQRDGRASESEEGRPPRLGWPMGHDQHCCGFLAGEFANDIWQKGPRWVDPDSLHLVHLVRELLPSRALASISLDRWSRLAGPESSEGVVEHYRGSIREGQPQRTPAAEGSHGGRPLSSKPQRCQFLIHPRESSLLGTGSGICACGQTPGSPANA